MRLRTSIEADLRSRIEDELRELADRRSNVDRFLRAEDVAAYRAAVSKAAVAARRPTLTDEHWLAPPDPASLVSPSDERPSSRPPRSFIAPPAPDASVRAASYPPRETFARSSSFPPVALDGVRRVSSYPPPFEPTLRSSFPPPPASSSSSVWTAVSDADVRDVPFARPRPRKGLLVAALAILTVTVGLFGSAATRVEIPAARASSGSGPTSVACSELAALENPVVVTAPAPTLKPASRHRSRPASPAGAKTDEPTSSAAPATASASPQATDPALQDAARTARMLREQLDGARH